MEIGERYGKLTTLCEMAERNNGHVMWKCLCDCGNTTIVQKSRLLSGHTRSCGCLNKTPNNWKDISGQRFGRLVAVKRVGSKLRGNAYHALWLCQCDCGNKKLITHSDLMTGRVFSCGCQKSEHITKHGGYKDRLYDVWVGIKDRCYNKNCKSYNSYGGRGIKVCDDWLENYSNFKKWAYENGYNENAKRLECTLDRINVSGDYEPNNCRWITIQEQNKNKRNTILIEIDGVTKCLADWCDEYGFPRDKAYHRRKAGKPIEQWIDGIEFTSIRAV